MQIIRIQNSTYNQDECSQEFGQKFLAYPVFESTVLPHTFLVWCFHVSLRKLQFELTDVPLCDPDWGRWYVLMFNLHLWPSTALQHTPLIPFVQPLTPAVLTLKHKGCLARLLPSFTIYSFGGEHTFSVFSYLLLLIFLLVYLLHSFPHMCTPKYNKLEPGA